MQMDLAQLVRAFVSSMFCCAIDWNLWPTKHNGCVVLLPGTQVSLHLRAFVSSRDRWLSQHVHLITAPVRFRKS